MRIRLPLGRALFFVLAFLFALVALLPLRVAVAALDLDKGGLAAREMQGSVWSGLVREMQWSGLALGDVQARLRTLPLLAMRARLDLDSLDGGQVNGAATVARGAVGIDDMTARIDVAGLIPSLPLTSLDLSDVTAHFAGGACRSAAGRVRAAVGTVPGLPPLGNLTGNARCDGGALLVPLQSQTGIGRLDLRLFGDGKYQAHVQLSARPEMAPTLTAAGFRPAANGYVLTLEGVL